MKSVKTNYLIIGSNCENYRGLFSIVSIYGYINTFLNCGRRETKFFQVAIGIVSKENKLR